MSNNSLAMIRMTIIYAMGNLFETALVSPPPSPPPQHTYVAMNDESYCHHIPKKQPKQNNLELHTPPTPKNGNGTPWKAKALWEGGSAANR
jgi:hypothetical protein